MASGKITVELKKSPIGRNPDQVGTLRALGLRKIGDKREHKDTPVIRGMVNKVGFMLSVK